MPKVHYCFSQHLNENLPPRKCLGKCAKNKRRCSCKRCKCREEVSPSRAHQLVKSGAAQYVLLKKEPVEIKKICPLCTNDDLLKKSCSLCRKAGEVLTTEYVQHQSNDIVMVTTGSGNEDEQVFRSVMSKQTPRVATIEYSHIIRAYVNEYPEDQDRINEYGKMAADFLKTLIVPFKDDPNDGRVLFPFGPDERSFPAIYRR